MLRNVLSQLDSGFLDKESVRLIKETILFSREASRLLQEQAPLRDFFNITGILAGRDVRLGAGAILLFLKKGAAQSDPWLGKMLGSLDKEFCLTSAELLMRETAHTAGWNFTEKTRVMLDEEAPVLAATIEALGLRFGTEFIIGAYLQLELLRRVEEGDFGMDVSNQKM
jgi:hypothetical protein